MGGELEALLKEQFHKFNIQFYILLTLILHAEYHPFWL